MAVRTGLEPATSCVTGRHSNQLNYRTKLRGQDLNLRPSGYEPDELPDCSTPRQVGRALLVSVARCVNPGTTTREAPARCARHGPGRAKRAGDRSAPARENSAEDCPHTARA